jgi:hypothetical protein
MDAADCGTNRMGAIATGGIPRARERVRARQAARPSHTKKAGDGGEKSLVSAHENPRGRMVRKPLLLRGFMHGEKALVDMGFYA